LRRSVPAGAALVVTIGTIVPSASATIHSGPCAGSARTGAGCRRAQRRACRYVVSRTRVALTSTP
jgi:hypothetical protein